MTMLGDVLFEESQVQRIAAALLARGEMLASAESCTGGLIAAACTSVAGSSRWFERGVVSYSNAAKTEWLGVDATLIEAHGAVSQAVALAMAHGVLDRSAAHWALSVTGIAGPDGGTCDKPVGTVWLALVARNGVENAWCEQFSGNRSQIRLATVRSGLAALELGLVR